MSDQTTAIAIVEPETLGLPKRPQTDVDVISDCLLKAASGANVLAPAMKITHLPPSHQISFMVVHFPTDGIRTKQDRDGNIIADSQQSNGVWYATDGGKLAHHRSALDQLAQAAGITWVSEKCGRTDDPRVPYKWSYRMTLRVKGLDGQVREVSREHELDLRSNDKDKSAAAAKAGRGLNNARVHGAQLCESKAANRAIRAALGLRSYTVEEAGRPFVLPVLQWVPDMSNPVIAEMVAAAELGLADELFGARTKAAMGQVHLVEQARVIDAPTDGEPAQLPAPIDATPQREPWDKGDQASTQQREQFKPMCGAEGCGLQLSNTQARRTADTSDGLRCQDHEAQQ